MALLQYSKNTGVRSQKLELIRVWYLSSQLATALFISRFFNNSDSCILTQYIITSFQEIKEVADWVANLRKRRNDLNIPFENLQRFISVEQEKYSPHFNDGDTDPRRWSDYFQKMWDNLNRLKAQKRQELRQIVHHMIEDRFRGPKFVRQFLEVLLEVFNNLSLPLNLLQRMQSKSIA